MSAALLTSNAFALLGYIAFALTFVKVRGVLAMNGLDVPTSVAVSLWALVALTAAYVANRRMFQEQASISRVFTRATLVCLIASGIFGVGFIAAASVSYNMTPNPSLNTDAHRRAFSPPLAAG
jgi:multidrug transporter EmrE-like cation transporter